MQWAVFVCRSKLVEGRGSLDSFLLNRPAAPFKIDHTAPAFRKTKRPTSPAPCGYYVQGLVPGPPPICAPRNPCPAPGACPPRGTCGPLA